MLANASIQAVVGEGDLGERDDLEIGVENGIHFFGRVLTALRFGHSSARLLHRGGQSGSNRAEETSAVSFVRLEVIPFAPLVPRIDKDEPL